MRPASAPPQFDRLLNLRNAGAHVRRYLVFYVALLCAVFTVTVYYPGYMSPDSVVQLGQARNGVDNNVYPPLMDYIWSVTDRILPGPAGMLVLHNAVFWFALALLAYVVVSRSFWQIAFVLVAGFWPPTYASVGTIWKDVGMQAFLLASVAAILYAHYRRRAWPLGVAVLCLFLAAGYRHNGIAAAVPLLVLCLFELAWLMPRRLPQLDAQLRRSNLLRAFYLGLGLLCLGGIMGALDFVNNYHKVNARLWSAAMVHDLAAISVQQNAKYLPQYIDPANEISADDLKGMYSPLHANSLFDPGCRRILGISNPSAKALHYNLGAADAADLQLYWFTKVMDNFGSYLHHRLAITSKLLVLDEGKPWYPYVAGIDPNPFGLTFHSSPLNSEVMKVMQASAFQYPLFSAWAYYLIVAACFVISFLWDFAHARTVQVLAASSYLYYLSIFMFSMSGDFRYNIWMITCAYICPLLLLAGRTSRTSNAPAARPELELEAVDVTARNIGAPAVDFASLRATLLSAWLHFDLADLFRQAQPMLAAACVNSSPARVRTAGCARYQIPAGPLICHSVHRR